MRTSLLAIEGDWERFAPWLSAAEQARLGNMRSRSAAAQSAHAWIALKRLAGEDGAEVRHGATGRPYLAGTSWAAGLAHTERLAAAALDTAPVGIDLEDLDREIAVDSFLDGVCTAPERELAEAVAGTALNLREVAIIFWSLKEAACKWADRPPDSPAMLYSIVRYARRGEGGVCGRRTGPAPALEDYRPACALPGDHDSIR